MLVLKGNVGKSVVLQSLIESYPDSYAIVYDKEPIGTIPTYYVSSKEFNLEDLCKSIKEKSKTNVNQDQWLLSIQTFLRVKSVVLNP